MFKPRSLLAKLVVAAAVVLAVAIPAFALNPSDNTNGGGTTLAIDAPGAAAGEFMLAHIAFKDADATFTVVPNGWTQIARQTNTSGATNGGLTQVTFGKIAGASEPGSYSWTFSESVRATGATSKHGEVEVDVSGTATGTDATLEAPSVDTTKANTTVTAFYALDSMTAFAVGGFPPSGMTSLHNYAVTSNPAAGQRRIAGASVSQAGIGATGQKIATALASTPWDAQTIALRPRPTKLAFTTSPNTGQTNDCLGPITVQTQNTAGAINPNAATVVGLSSNGTGSFFSDACSTALTASDRTLSTSSNSFSFYYKPTVRGSGGSHSLTASATGLTSGNQAQTVNRLSQEITINTGAPASKKAGQGFTVDASAPGGPVTYGGSGACSNTGANFTMTAGTGTCTVTYDRAQDDEYTAAPQKTEFVTAEVGDQTITFDDAPASAGYGETFNVDPTSSSGLAVTVASAVSDGCDVVAGTTGWDVTMTSSTVSCELTASQPGNADYSAATDVPATVTATKGSQTITFAQPTTPRTYGATFNVNPTSDSGLAVIVSSAVGDGCDVVAGTTGWDVTMTSGTTACELTASQGGNDDYNAATDITHTVAAQKANQTITFSQPTTPRTFGATFNVNPTSDSGLTVALGATGGCSVAPGTTGYDVTMTSGTTACVLTASHAGNDNFNAASNVQHTVAAQKASQTITFDTPTEATFGETFNVNPTSDSGLAVAVISGNSDGCDIVAATIGYDVTMTSGTKSCNLTASQAGNGNYLAASNVPKTITAVQASQAITFAQPASPATYGDTFNVDPTSDSGLTVSLDATGGCSVAPGTTGYDVTVTSGRHDCVLSATQSGNPDFAAATAVQRTVDVNKKVLTVTGASAHGKTYDGATSAEVDFTAASLTGAINGDTPSLDTSGAAARFANKAAGTGKGVSVLGLTLVDPDDADNYSVSASGLTADVAKRNVTGNFTAKDKYYDGTTAATIGSRSLSGALGGDSAALAGGSAKFGDPNVGLDKPVTGTGFSLAGTDKGNYNLVSVGSTTASIVQRGSSDSPQQPDDDNPIIDAATNLLGSPVTLLSGVDLGGTGWAFAPEGQPSTLRVGAGGLPVFAIGGCATACTIDVGKAVVLKGTTADAGTAATRKMALKSQHFALDAGELGLVKLKLSKRQRKAIGNARKAKLVLKMALDAAGDEVTAKKTYRLKLKKS